MRPSIAPDNAFEYIGLKLGLAPVPVAEAMFAQPLARVVIAAQKLGVFRRLLEGSVTAPQLAAEKELQPAGVAMLLDSLAALGHVKKRGDSYSLSSRTRKWVDPASETYVGTFIEHTQDYWKWWDRLEEVLQTGDSEEIHSYPPDDPSWEVYIRGQYELARLSAPEVAKALRLSAKPERLLDVAGAHGWFAAALCRRHPTLHATVVDLPGSVAVGRVLIAENGMSDRVEHVEGDMFEADFGGPHDAALAFNIIHHLSPEQIVALFRRIADALKPGGSLAVLDLFTQPAGKQPDTGSFLGLFFYLTSGAGTYSAEQLRDWLAEAGFGAPRKITIRRIPGQTLYQAIKR